MEDKKIPTFKKDDPIFEKEDSIFFNSPKRPKIDFRKLINRLLAIGLVVFIVFAVIAVVGYIARNQYISEKNNMGRQIVANAVKNSELAEAFRYPTCAGEPNLTTLGRNRPKIKVRALRNCWSGWIKVNGYCYFHHTDSGNVYVWFKEDYNADLPPVMQVDGTHTRANKSCYFRFRAEKEPVEMTVEAR